MRIVVRKSFVEEYSRNNNEIFIMPFYLENDENINKSFWNGAVHPRNSKGQFTNKDVADLTEKETECLIKALKKEKYYNVDGVKVHESKYKILHQSVIGLNPNDKDEKKKMDAILNNQKNVREEIEGCKQLQKEGYKNIYLLRNNYSSGSNADAIVTKGKKMFLELKHTDHDVTKQYNRSITQARNVIITYTGNFNKQARKNLKDSVKANLKAEDVMIWKPVDENVEYINKKE